MVLIDFNLLIFDVDYMTETIVKYKIYFEEKAISVRLFFELLRTNDELIDFYNPLMKNSDF
ncbi:hypothetical protein HNQ88_003368 [Aureibacter tunicatorum]|uniref:Uncharacterized protein n=1 Tax=Aureibacter tunicatorum TaxID=866807 RepID=A0AAE3XNP5_9BACT|nr:hypothetical protein [Aureibacter tunicatorum]BDD05817.1 hypothetical protein AUTU_33000 [Aureibacter tunicatorum]